MAPRILITAGDPLGIGPEITAKAVAAFPFSGADLTVIGDGDALKENGFRPGRVPLIPMDAPRTRGGKRGPRAETGLASFRAVELALDLLEKGLFDALVTAPVSKEAWELAGLPHAGHTDLFRCRTGREPLMGFTCGTVTAALVTEHVPIKLLSGRITGGLVREKARLFAGALKGFGKAKPRIIVSALNPHAGDGGLLGREELSVLAPAVRSLRREGLDISGPAPADSAWRRHLNGDCEGLLCLYHDQALTPLKILKEAASAVHWTWGLPFARTSPVHGTAFDIAGLGKADPAGMITALRFAAVWAGSKA